MLILFFQDLESAIKQNSNEKICAFWIVWKVTETEFIFYHWEVENIHICFFAPTQTARENQTEIGEKIKKKLNALAKTFGKQVVVVGTTCNPFEPSFEKEMSGILVANYVYNNFHTGNIVLNKENISKELALGLKWIY